MKNFFLQSYSAHAGVISEAPSISEILLNILKFLLSVIGIVAILSIVIAGIRYVVVRNTHQAEGVKKSLVAIIIGLIVAMSALIILSALGNFLG